MDEIYSKSQDSVDIGIIDPNNISIQLLDRMNIDIGIRSLVGNLLMHGYDTKYSCEGHGIRRPYIAFRKGTGDGTFERVAAHYGLELIENKPCCSTTSENFCCQCSSSNNFRVYRGEKEKPISLIGKIF